jgi:hypothetical protein
MAQRRCKVEEDSALGFREMNRFFCSRFLIVPSGNLIDRCFVPSVCILPQINKGDRLLASFEISRIIQNRIPENILKSCKDPELSEYLQSDSL